MPNVLSAGFGEREGGRKKEREKNSNTLDETMKREDIFRHDWVQQLRHTVTGWRREGPNRRMGPTTRQLQLTHHEKKGPRVSWERPKGSCPLPTVW